MDIGVEISLYPLQAEFAAVIHRFLERVNADARFRVVSNSMSTQLFGPYDDVLEVVRRQGDSGRSVIFISHRFVEISALCDRATVLRDGSTVGVVDIEPGVEEKIVEMMLGARIEKTRVAARAASQVSAAKSSRPRLSVRNLQLGTKLTHQAGQPIQHRPLQITGG